MKKRGFTLIEVIVAIFLIGLVTILGLPIVQNSITNYNRIKEKRHMYYLCEMAVERLRAKDKTLESICTELETKNEITVSSIGSTELDKYKCRITKIKETDMHWFLEVRIYIDNEMRNSSYVEYKTVVEK